MTNRASPPSRSPQGATARLEPRRELGRSTQPPGRASCTLEGVLWPLSRRGWVRRTAYDGPLTSGSRPDAYGRTRARQGASSFPKRPGWMCAAPRYPLRPYSSTAARGGLALGASPRPSEGSLGGDDTATMRAPPWPSTAPKALRMVFVLGLQRRRRGWSRGFPTVDAKWPAGARA